MDPKETACNHLGICENVGGLCLHCLNQSWIKSIVNPMLAEKRCPLPSQSIILPSAHKQTNKQTKLLLPFETVSVFADLLSSPNLVHLSCVGVSVQSCYVRVLT